MRMPSSRRAAVVTIVALSLLLSVPTAFACPVCFGAAPGSRAANAMNNAILFLLAIVGLVQIGFAALFFSWWRRSRELSRKSKSIAIIEGGLS